MTQRDLQGDAPPDGGARKLRQRARRALRAYPATGNFPRWLARSAVPGVALFALLLLYSSLRLGWWKTYNLLIGIDSPEHANLPILALIVSAVGWLIIPATVGGVAGYIIQKQISRPDLARIDRLQALRLIIEPATDKERGR